MTSETHLGRSRRVECRRPPPRRANAVGSLGSDSSARRITLSTVQFGGTAPFPTVCNDEFHGPGIPCRRSWPAWRERCMSLKRCEIDGAVNSLCQCADSAAQLAEVGVAVSGLDALKRGAQLRIVGDRLGEQVHLSAEGRRSVLFQQCGLAASAASACCFASAKRVPARMLKELIEHDKQQPAVGISCGAAHKRIGESQHDKQQAARSAARTTADTSAGDGAWSSGCRARRTSASSPAAAR